MTLNQNILKEGHWIKDQRCFTSLGLGCCEIAQEDPRFLYLFLQNRSAFDPTTGCARLGIPFLFILGVTGFGSSNL